MSLSADALKHMIKETMREEREAREANSQPVESTVDHVCGCPNCLCGVMDKLNKTSKYACAHCGFPLGDDSMLKQLEKCPNCGRKEPKKVRG